MAAACRACVVNALGQGGAVGSQQGHGSSEARGTWRMDANGRRYVNVDLPCLTMKWKQCAYTYRLGDQLFAAASDIDRSVIATRCI
ncbi:MAG: hypothetical protein IPF55_01960 [Rhodoferax sp.]|jgi:hypothetical protein|nr:hypothetical protein [Rhodoferax sp.]